LGPTFSHDLTIAIDCPAELGGNHQPESRYLSEQRNQESGAISAKQPSPIGLRSEDRFHPIDTP
jgi:hypothetical protein